MISRKLIIALKLSTVPEYRIAQKAGLNPSVLSKLTHGIVQVSKGDPRVIKVGKVLGISPEECFEKEASNPVCGDE